MLNFKFVKVYPSFSMVKSRKKYKVFSKAKIVTYMVVFAYVKSKFKLGLLLFWMVVHSHFYIMKIKIQFMLKNNNNKIKVYNNINTFDIS